MERFVGQEEGKVQWPRYGDDTLGHLQHLSGCTLFSPFRGLVIGANLIGPTFLVDFKMLPRIDKTTASAGEGRVGGRVDGESFRYLS